ncbi:MAG: A/G-specific adenine glycosylase [Gammaproteobacteria bacterium]|jgi:A/G-specific adenine glycosylase
MNEFAARVLAWFAGHGRHDLPWQHPATPYRVWISEVMLQQTQVATVIPYFERFMAAFPDVPALAGAGQDDVLGHWSGLGYYARGRNLHKAAQEMVAHHGGELPADLEALTDLPGIGRSTAGAILSLGFGIRAPILDGNVKRVLARYHAMAGWAGQAGVLRRLWELAENHTPHEQVGEYTQAMMDLGATCCTRTRPRCDECPLQSDCQAFQAGQTAAFPAPRPRRRLPERETVMLVVRNPEGETLLERRPPSGLWGGLWSLPEVAREAEIDAWCRKELGCSPQASEALAAFTHTFTHFRLTIRPVAVQVNNPAASVMEGAGRVWYNTGSPAPGGFPRPVATLLKAHTS